MTLLELLGLYAAKRLRGGSPNTLRLYKHTIRSYSKTLGRDATLDDLDSDAIESHMWRLVNAGGSPASANKDRGQLICLWKWAFERRIVATLPDVQAMKEPEQMPFGWLPEEVERLLDACARERQPYGEIPGDVWFTALIHVLLDTGERVGAIRQLDRSCLQGRFLLVPAALRKGRTRDRLYPLEPVTLQAIKQLLSHHKQPTLFHDSYSQTYLYARFNKILDRAKLPRDRRSKFHRLRRTVASAVARAGGDPTAALDHASPRTTKKYLDPRIVGGVEVSQILANYLKDPALRKNDDRRKTG